MKYLQAIGISVLAISSFTFVQNPTISHFANIVMLFSVVMAMEVFIRFADKQKQPIPYKFQIYEPSEIAKQYHALPSNSYVYILQDIDVTGYCKIGRTATLYKRIHDIGVKVPFRTQVVHVIRCEDMNIVEKTLHTVFAEYRIDGEWFNLDIVAIEYLKSKERIP